MAPWNPAPAAAPEPCPSCQAFILVTCVGGSHCECGRYTLVLAICNYDDRIFFHALFPAKLM